MAVPQWIALTLKGLGAKQSPTNVAALEEWASSEGMPAAANNPLAASDQITGSTMHPGWTVPWYPTIQAAADLYVTKLKSSTYEPIGFALISGQDLNIIYDTINSSPWCSGCQGGHYPIVMYDQLTGNTTPILSPRHATGPGGLPLGGKIGGMFPGIFSGWGDLRGSFNKRLPRALAHARQSDRAALAAIARLHRGR